MSTKNKMYRNVISIPHAILHNEGTIHLHEDTYLVDHVNANNLPTDKHIIMCLVIMLCEEGEMRFECSGKTYHACANDLICLFQPEIVESCKVISKEYKGKAIMLGTSLIHKLAEGYEATGSLYYKITHAHKTSLTLQEVQVFQQLYQAIKSILSSKALQKTALSLSLQRILIHRLLVKNQQQQDNPLEDEDRYNFKQFTEEVESKIRHTRQVQKYCDLLKISVHTLERIVQKYANVSPKEFINREAIKDICIIIESSNMTNLQIAHYLNFSSLSTLCRFFKSRMKKSMSNYRHEVRVQQRYTAQHTSPCQSVL